MILDSVYLDYAATTPVASEVLEAMWPFYADPSLSGNPNSGHTYGQNAAEAVTQAEHHLLRLLGTKLGHVIWTSGATEANHLALLGVANAYQQHGKHMISITTEHQAVLAPLKRLKEQGWQVTLLTVDRAGQLDMEQLRRSLRADTVLVSTMVANNETGVMHPLNDIAKILIHHPAKWHVDAAQAIGRVPIDVDSLGIDLLTLSGHKMYAPKGIGALYVRRTPRVSLKPMIVGGGQQHGLRAGTLPVPLIVGMGQACRLWQQLWAHDSAQQAKWLDDWLSQLQHIYPELIVHAQQATKVPHIRMMALPTIEPQLLRSWWPELMMSFGSACHGASINPSHVLTAMGVAPAIANRSIRLSIGLGTTQSQLDYALTRFSDKLL